METKQCTLCKKTYPKTKDFFNYRTKKHQSFSSWCIACTKEKYTKWSSSHKEYLKENSKKRREGKRLAVLKFYGGDPPKCSCCGETNLEFLAIDHINGNGSKHRRSINRVGGAFYQFLIIEGFPEGYRVLCHNCNMSLGFYGYCPHNKE